MEASIYKKKIKNAAEASTLIIVVAVIVLMIH